MSISGVNNNILYQSSPYTFSTSGINPLGSVTPSQDGDGDHGQESSGLSSASSSPAASVSISSMSQIYSKLQQLQTQNPAQYNQLLTGISSQLSVAAQNSTGPESSFLSSLSKRFSQAANGNLQALQPIHPTVHHGHHENKTGRVYRQQSGFLTGQPILAPFQSAIQAGQSSVSSASSSSLQQVLAGIYNQLNNAFNSSSSISQSGAASS